MWDEQKRHRFAELRQNECDGVLSEAERDELAGLPNELCDQESSYLLPATQRLRQQYEVLDAQNRRLAALTARKANLVERLRDFLGAAEVERRAIDGELEAVLAGAQDSQAGG